MSPFGPRDLERIAAAVRTSEKRIRNDPPDTTVDMGREAPVQPCLVTSLTTNADGYYPAKVQQHLAPGDTYSDLGPCLIKDMNGVALTAQRYGCRRSGAWTDGTPTFLVVSGAGGSIPDCSRAAAGQVNGTFAQAFTAGLKSVDALSFFYPGTTTEPQPANADVTGAVLANAYDPGYHPGSGGAVGVYTEYAKTPIGGGTGGADGTFLAGIVAAGCYYIGTVQGASGTDPLGNVVLGGIIRTIGTGTFGTVNSVVIATANGVSGSTSTGFGGALTITISLATPLSTILANAPLNVTGSRGATTIGGTNIALTALISALVTLGLITDSTTF